MEGSKQYRFRLRPVFLQPLGEGGGGEDGRGEGKGGGGGEWGWSPASPPASPAVLNSFLRSPEVPEDLVGKNNAVVKKTVLAGKVVGEGLQMHRWLWRGGDGGGGERREGVTYTSAIEGGGRGGEKIVCVCVCESLCFHIVRNSEEKVHRQQQENKVGKREGRKGGMPSQEHTANGVL